MTRQTKNSARLGFCLFFLIPLISVGEVTPNNPVSKVTQSDSSVSRESEVITSQADEFDLLEDSSVGEALGRRQDLKFRNVTIDGETSRVSLSTISTDSVELVEIMKAVTPDLDADTRGGLISLRSKPAFKLKKRVIKGGLELEYNSLLDEFFQEGSFTYGQAFGAEKQFGFLFTAAAAKSIVGSDSIKMEWEPEPIESGSIFVLEDQFIENNRTDISTFDFNGTFDYRISDKASVYFRVIYNRSEVISNDHTLRLRYGKGDYVEADPDTARIVDAHVKRDSDYTRSEVDEYTLALGGFYDWDKVSFDYRLSYFAVDDVAPDNFDINFIRRDVDLTYRLDDRQFPTYTVDNDVEIGDSDEFEFEDLSSARISDNNSDLIATFNFKIRHKIGSEPGFFKFGVKYRAREIEQITDSMFYEGFNGLFLLSEVKDAGDRTGLIEGRYDFGPATDPGKARRFFRENLEQFIVDEKKSREDSDPNTFNATENVSAAYAMGSFEFGNLLTIAGLRYEKTDLSFTGQEVIIDENGEYQQTNSLAGSNSYTNYFPSLHARYLLGDKLTIIASWTRTIERPEFEILVPFRSIDIEEMEIDEGSPSLKPTLHTNYDLSIDYALNDEDLISVEFFYRELDDFIFTFKSIEESGLYEGFELRKDINTSGGASLIGFEITWEQSLSFLPGILDGFGFNINYIYTDSEIIYPDRPGIILPLARTPENEIKITLTYEKGPFFGQLEYSKRSLSLSRISSEPERDSYLFANHEFDLSISYQLHPKVRLIAEIKNLTSEPNRVRYSGDPSRPRSYDWVEWIAEVGFKFDL